MIFCAPISSLEQVRKWERFLSLYPLLFFPAHGKILAWAGRKIYQGREGIDNYHLTEIYIAYSLSTNDLFTTRISDRQKSVFRVYGWRLTCAPLCFSGAQLCSYPSTKVPLPWRNSALPQAFYYLGETRTTAWHSVLLFPYYRKCLQRYLFENRCGGFQKNLYSVENLKSECDFTLHPSSFLLECR